jgi:hypothetical protein
MSGIVVLGFGPGDADTDVRKVTAVMKSVMARSNV